MSKLLHTLVMPSADCLTDYLLQVLVAASKYLWTAGRLMSLEDKNNINTYPFENIKIKKDWGSGRGSIQQ